MADLFEFEHLANEIKLWMAEKRALVTATELGR
jgi:hypothetical protein